MSLTINALTRDDQGKGASHRLRRNHKIPAIVYGTGKAPRNITLDVFEITRLLENEESYTSVLDLIVDKKKEAVIIKDLQRHPAKNIVTHVDFLRINLKQAIVTSVPLHFNGEENNEAMRLGAILNQFVTSVEVSCLPTDLPHAIDVDISNLTMGEHISFTGLNIPKGVVITALTHGDIETHNRSVVAIQEPRKIAEIEEETSIIVEDENIESNNADKNKSNS
ncbi:LSU ribosomal protein L25P [Candidatus Ruthia magnifica str. Cm (Calyptogena magnifica)]|uniref:Large ribosomal subunit protein bL25 n=1 Tax=Ruthia magnifica subsp. Calyptogena magnifica TaxID=413404 RepID=RL25_RUTMC|nr:50S ribosomal protein L25/general stress protein Ctc [Candidatus Ruthturnera calyptogenae]A1AXW4.1 RecName: Full=Large ribosomal subunit protein bL25; AltName: Full=50S ribosomal protein L25; AltName: Full=General stress protein CTC [Candidatus Ruthia magnifica str. Cm (Calyptogena magnifica)]ABL02771.1 LSU ribosomal protein L25P [Candidatus Ruthia magnifica str. Cm (Calyptogena magnifica)]